MIAATVVFTGEAVVTMAVPASGDTDSIRCAEQAPGPWPPAVSRIQGSDRYATAVEISKRVTTQTDAIYIASGASFADGLTAGAGVGHFFPTLLVPGRSLPDGVRKEIIRRAPEHIVVVGGEGAVSAAVYQELSTLAGSIERISGRDRYETSRLAIELDLARYQTRHLRHLAIATGRNYPDALAVSGVVFGGLANLLLVDGSANRLDAPTTAFLQSVQVDTITVVGGPGAVSSGVEAGVRALFPGARIGRVAGADRYATSQALVNAWPPVTGTARNDCADAILVTGANFPDALAASVLSSGPFWVVPPTCIPQAVLDKAKALRVERFWLIGGTGALGKGVESLTTCEALAAQAAAKKPPASTSCTVPKEFVGGSSSGPLSCAEYLQAKAIAAQLVAPLRGKDLKAQIEGVYYALLPYTQQGLTYSMSDPHYADPYGLLVLHRASCAGVARATGLLLAELGIPWRHINPNAYTHQWAQVTVNGVKYRVDPAASGIGVDDGQPDLSRPFVVDWDPRPLSKR